MITPDGIELRSGGRDPRRGVDFGDPLEASIYFQLGPLMVRRRGDVHLGYDLCVRVWESLTNVVWTGDGRHGGMRVLHGFRSAGDVIAAILDEGTYHDWYCCGSPGTIDPEVRRLLGRSGWTPSRSEPPTHKIP